MSGTGGSGGSPVEPRDSLDDLLSAPDSVRKNEVESRKHHQRKEAERARVAQLESKKRPDPPTVEDLLADIIRVADDENTNPYWRFRSISRRRYELYGLHSIQWIDKQFGQFEEALRVAGLRDEMGTRVWRANRARNSRLEHAQRYMDRYCAPYVLDAKRLNWNAGGFSILSINDTHSVFLHPFVWHAFCSAVRDLVPDMVLMNGDIIDANSISSHAKIPGRTVDLQIELDFQKEMHRQLRTVYDGKILNVGGNHDIADRLSRHLAHVSAGIAGLRSLRVDHLLGLDEYDVQLAHGGSVLSPSGTEDQKPGVLLFDFYRIHHGTKLGQTPARSELLAAGRSGQSGHVHRASLHYGTTERDEGMSWMSVPAGCREEVARDYIKDVTAGWQSGFGFARLFDDGTVHQYPCVVQYGRGGAQRLTVEGITYTRPETMDDPPNDGVWIEDDRWKFQA